MRIVLSRPNPPLLIQIDKYLKQRICNNKNVRFTCVSEILTRRVIKLSEIRLTDNKPYCGQHPGACNIQHTGPHKRYKFLEGCDWVEINDRVNDILDNLAVDANVYTSVCILRQGQKRCIEYLAQNGHGPNLEWKREGIYENWCRKNSPTSRFPQNTPGTYKYKKTVYECEG